MKETSLEEARDIINILDPLVCHPTPPDPDGYPEDDDVPVVEDAFDLAFRARAREKFKELFGIYPEELPANSSHFTVNDEWTVLYKWDTFNGERNLTIIGIDHEWFDTYIETY